MTTEATAPALTGEALRQAVAEALPGWKTARAGERAASAVTPTGSGSVRVLPYDDGEVCLVANLDVPAAVLPRVLAALRGALGEKEDR